MCRKIESFSDYVKIPCCFLIIPLILNMYICILLNSLHDQKENSEEGPTSLSTNLHDSNSYIWWDPSVPSYNN